MAAGLFRVVASQQGLTRAAFASGLIPRLTDFTPALREALAIRRRSTKREFDQGGQLLPSGGLRRWRKTRDFFDRKAPSQTLVRSGDLLRSLMGENAHSIERFTPNSVTFGSSLPYAAYHREGARIRITAKMRGWVLHQFGRTFRAGKRTIVLPVRGFGGATVETREEIGQTFLRFFATGKAATA